MIDTKYLEIIKAPVITEKAANIAQVEGKYVFKVDPKATKDEIKAAVEAKGLELSDFTFKSAFEVYRDTTVDYDLTGRNSHTVLFEVTVAAGQHVIVIHKTGGNSYDFAIDEYNEGLVCISGVTSFSPFYIYVGGPQNSPQTGDFAPAYIAMISVALISCGAIFAVRAKKATK